VSTLSDVYALGVLLYELLVGLRPYRAEGRNPIQLERALARERPAPPSRAAVDDGGAGGTDLATGRPDAATRASLRGVAGAERLRRQLAGDLDVIIARALAHDPERRYGSVAALAEDLSRYLNGWPVHAQRDGFSYRASKFVKRHRIAVAAAALGTAAVLVGAATTTWQARRARDAAIRAEAEAGRARQVTALVTDLFRLSDPTRTRGDTVTARQLLDEGTARIERELVGQPTLQATLLDEVAKVYRNLGLLPRAEELGRRVLELREVLDPGSRGHAAALATLGEVVTERGRPQEGVDLYRTALALPGLGASADADTLRARVQAGLAWALRDLGRHEEAAQLFREALGAQRPTLGDGSPTTARTLMGLASALHDEGRFDEAEALFAESLLGNPAPDRPEAGVAAALANLGMLRRLRQDYLGAEPMLRTALTFRTTLFGPDHPETLASMDSWGAELLELGRPAEARAVLADARERAIAVSGANHSATVSITEALAWALDDLGDYRVAEALRDSAIATKRRSRGGDHAGIVYSLIRQARGAREAGRIDRAAGILDSARAMGRRLSEEEGVYRALGLHEEAHVASARGDRPLAERAFTDAERLLRERLREDHRYVLAVTRDRALFRLRSGADPDSVVAVLERVEEAQARHRPSPHPERARTALALGEARLAAGDARGAARAFEAAEDALSTIPPAHWLRGAARVGRGLAEGRPDWIDAGQRVVEAHLGADAPEARRLRAAGSARQP
jgi:tetratricopeptide (TPR) repeat protein